MSTTLADTVVERLADLPRAAPALELLVLFGSMAKDRATAKSDVDLAVRCDAVADLEALYLHVASRLRTDRVDLIDLRRAGPLVAFQVARDGRLLFERRPGAFREFQSLASRRYADSEKYRRLQRDVIRDYLRREGLA